MNPRAEALIDELIKYGVIPPENKRIEPEIITLKVSDKIRPVDLAGALASTVFRGTIAFHDPIFIKGIQRKEMVWFYADTLDFLPRPIRKRYEDIISELEDKKDHIEIAKIFAKVTGKKYIVIVEGRWIPVIIGLDAKEKVEKLKEVVKQLEKMPENILQDIGVAVELLVHGIDPSATTTPLHVEYLDRIVPGFKKRYEEVSVENLVDTEKITGAVDYGRWLEFLQVPYVEPCRNAETIGEYDECMSNPMISTFHALPINIAKWIPDSVNTRVINTVNDLAPKKFSEAARILCALHPTCRKAYVIRYSEPNMAGYDEEDIVAFEITSRDARRIRRLRTILSKISEARQIAGRLGEALLEEAFDQCLIEPSHACLKFTKWFLDKYGAQITTRTPAPPTPPTNA